MRVLLTGHGGYIGAVAAPMIIEAGHEVVGLDSLLFAGCGFGDDTPPAAMREIRKDLRDLEASDLEGFEAVLHFAGLSNDPLGDLDQALTHDKIGRASCRERVCYAV